MERFRVPQASVIATCVLLTLCACTKNSPPSGSAPPRGSVVASDDGSVTVAIVASPPAPLTLGKEEAASITIRFVSDSRALGGSTVTVTFVPPDCISVAQRTQVITLDASGAASLPCTMTLIQKSSRGTETVLVRAIHETGLNEELELDVRIAP